MGLDAGEEMALGAGIRANTARKLFPELVFCCNRQLICQTDLDNSLLINSSINFSYNHRLKSLSTRRPVMDLHCTGCQGIVSLDVMHSYIIETHLHEIRLNIFKIPN